MAGILGRWGDGNELPIVLDILRAIRSQADKIGSGLTIWLHIRSYPAVLVFTAYALGLVRTLAALAHLAPASFRTNISTAS